MNSKILSTIHQALRQAWATANPGFLMIDDLLIPNILPTMHQYVLVFVSFYSMTSIKLTFFYSFIFYLIRNDQIALDYLIGFRLGDVGDYANPSERIYSDIFNRTGLGDYVTLDYKPRSSQEMGLNNDAISLFPFDYQSGGPFYGVL